MFLYAHLEHTYTNIKVSKFAPPNWLLVRGEQNIKFGMCVTKVFSCGIHESVLRSVEVLISCSIGYWRSTE